MRIPPTPGPSSIVEESSHASLSTDDITLKCVVACVDEGIGMINDVTEGESMMKSITLTLASITALALGCATAPPRTFFVPTDGTPGNPQAFARAKAHCARLAMTAFPQPTYQSRTRCTSHAFTCGFDQGYSGVAAGIVRLQRQDLFETCLLGEGWAKVERRDER